MGRRIFRALCLTVLVLAGAVSCSSLPGPEPSVVGDTVFLPQDEGASVEATLHFDGAWRIRNNNSWFRVMPLSGSAGDNTLTFSVSESNAACRERESTIEIIIGDEEKTYYVVQKGRPGVEFSQDAFSIKASDESPRIVCRTNTEISASVDADWISVQSIEYGKSSDLLSDGQNLSDFQECHIVFDAQPNPSDSEVRNAVLTVVCGGDTTQVDVMQLYPMDKEADFGKMFRKRSLGVRHTATWCQFCPNMGEAFGMAADDSPDRIVQFNIHASNSDVKSGIPDDLMRFYGVSGLPTGFVNMMAKISNDDVAKVAGQISSLAEEAVTDFPAATAISVESSVSGRTVSLSAYVAFKEQRDWRLHIYVMEDGIVSPQNLPTGGADNGYVHDNVERTSVTGLDGEPMRGVDSGVVLEYSTTFDIPSDVVENLDNAWLCVFTTYDTEVPVTGSVPYVNYIDLGRVVDNVVAAPLSGTLDFEYEN